MANGPPIKPMKGMKLMPKASSKSGGIVTGGLAQGLMSARAPKPGRAGSIKKKLFGGGM